MKKLAITLTLLLAFAGSAGAIQYPNNIGTIFTFLDAYANSYSELTVGDAQLFNFDDVSDEWWYTAIASEAGNMNITEDPNTDGDVTFKSSVPGGDAEANKFGTWEYVDFSAGNLYYTDTNDSDPTDLALNGYITPVNLDNSYFRVFEIGAGGANLDYLSLYLKPGTIIVGFNDNGQDQDKDWDDLIVAMTPIPEPSLLLLIGSGIACYVAVKRKRGAARS
jgi:hypothetical protein